MRVLNKLWYTVDSGEFLLRGVAGLILPQKSKGLPHVRAADDIMMWIYRSAQNPFSGFKSIVSFCIRAVCQVSAATHKQ